MSILDIRKDRTQYKFKKTVIVYSILSILAIVVDKVYALFGHGVSSEAMTWMFLYPLIGGGLFYLFLGVLLPFINRFTGYRLFYNIYNSGIAVLTVGSLLKGIMDIAGLRSSYTKFYYIAGYVFLVSGIIILFILAVNYKKLLPVKQ